MTKKALLDIPRQYLVGESGYTYGIPPQSIAYTGPGTTGPAPNTVWFGHVPDQLNMLRPGATASINGGPYFQNFAANFLNQWTIFNDNLAVGANNPDGSLGGFTTAPDGTTNTAQLFVESTPNKTHSIWAISLITGYVGPCRLSGFFKSTNRRIQLRLQTDVPIDTIVTHRPNFSSGGGGGAKVTFDLVGGQIGVPAAAISGGTLIGAEIVPYPGGWYKCSIDAVMSGSVIDAVVILDNGTGTNAESITYAGDGASGVYGWRVNVMPIPAYALNNTVFFDDFTSTSTIDLTNSLAPGFNWYLAHSSPLLPYNGTRVGLAGGIGDPAGITQSGSILHLLAGHGQANVPPLNSFASLTVTAPSGYVGNGWKPPALFEASFGYDYAASGPGNDSGAFWGWDIEYLCGEPFSAAFGNGPQNFGLTGREIDFFEDFRTPAQGGSAITYEQIQGNQTTLTTNTFKMCLGSAPWNATHTFQGNETCFYVPNSTYYIGLIANNVNNIPPSTLGTAWKLYSDQSAPFSQFQNMPPVTIDPAAQHKYSALMLAYGGSGPIIYPGLVMGFFDGIYCQLSPIPWWGPNNNFGGMLGYQSNDFQHFGMVLNAGNSIAYNFDWVKVTQ